MENESKEKKRKGGFFSGTFKVIIALVIIAGVLAATLNEYYIDFLWFKELGYTDVFFKSLFTHLKLGLPLFAAMFVILSVYFKLLTLSGGKAYVVDGDKPSFVKRRLPYIIAFLISAVSSAVCTSSLWYKFLEFKNSVDFGDTDPVFGLDISFYMFKLPFLKSVTMLLFYIVLLLFAATFVYSMLVIMQKSSAEKKFFEETDNDNVKVKGFFARMWASFRAQITVFMTLLCVFGAAYFYLKRYDLLYSQNGLVFGASFTDLHVTLLMYNIISGILVFAAVVTLICGIAKRVKPMVFCYIAAAAVYALNIGASVVVENLIVSPNEYSKESVYIDYNIAATQQAYGLDEIETRTYTVDNSITAQDIAENAITVENIPINDYSPTLDTYNSLQSMRTYYKFNDVDVDRYNLNGDYTQVFLSAREMDTSKLNEDAQTWINTYLKYTHGFGVAVSPVNSITETGQPVLVAKDIPTQSSYTELEVTQPRIYFGESTNGYAVVNTRAKEFDYPSGSDNAENVYDGSAGIPMNTLNKISFSVSEGTLKFLLSGDITSESRILINRNVMQRVMTIAPFLSYDNDIYMVINDGKLYWIVDAVTTSDLYPYAQPCSGGFNYIRNSVKAVVDAYNGTVDYYIVDEDDPIAAVYAKIYPDLFKSKDEMPEGIREHLRYSEAYFKVQAEMYKTYHMSNTSVFYNKEDAWSIATQYYDTDKTGVNVNPAYMIMKLPGRDEEFLLMLPYTAVNKNNMVAWMAGICDGDEYGKLVVYEFNKQSLVYGPMQIEQRIDQDTVIAPQLNLLAQQGSSVVRGNLLTIPIEDSILYIEPIYVRATQSATSLPEMKKVVLSYKDDIIMADTLKEALEEMFGAEETPSGDESKPTESENGSSALPPSTDFAALAKQAQELYGKAQEALSSGDWTSYGSYMEELGEILNKLAEYGSVSVSTPSTEQSGSAESQSDVTLPSSSQTYSDIEVNNTDDKLQ